MIRTPPGVSSRDFAAALRQFESAVGKDWVFTSEADVDLYRDAYTPFWGEEQELVASAAVAPDSVKQVQLEACSFNNHALLRFHETVKDAVDPDGILSAGRYGIWPKHLRDKKT